MDEIEWDDEYECYEIDLDTADGRKGMLRVETNGNFINKEIELSFSEVPPQLQTLIKRELDVTGIEDIMLMTTRRGEKIYKVDAENQKGREIELDLAEDGTIVKKEF